MARPFSPKIVTANALLEGDVIYMTADGGWTRALRNAALFTDEASADAALAATKSDNHIVGAYLVDARLGDNGVEGTHFREDFRAAGPSNYAHGKKAEAEYV